MMRFVKAVAILALLAILAPESAEAHKVIASVFKSGDAIEGEIGFSNGAMAENVLVEVFDGEGNKIGETRTDQHGFFVFTPTKPVEHVFRADLGAGHVAEARFPVEDLPAAIRAPSEGPAGEPGADGADEAPDGSEGPQATSTVGDPQVRVAGMMAVQHAGMMQAEADMVTEAQLAVVAAAVRDEVRPLRREIAAYKERNDLQTILGGIGYIVGIFGILFYLLARRRYGKG